MKVRELVQFLKNPAIQDHEVILSADEEGNVYTRAYTLELLEFEDPYQYRPELADEGGIEVVVISP